MGPQIVALSAAAVADPSAELAQLPLGFFVVPDYAARALLIERCAVALCGKHVPVFFGVDVRGPDGGFVAPPPGLLGTWDAAENPFVSSYAYLHHRRHGWVLNGERQRVSRRDQRVDDVALPARRIVEVDGARLGIVLGPERFLPGVTGLVSGADRVVYGQRAGRVTSVSSSASHTMSKDVQPVINLIAGRSCELRTSGFVLRPGQLGENVTTRGVELLSLPRGTRLKLGDDAVVEVTGLRNPCAQLDGIAPGLMAATLERDGEGGLTRKAGIMAVVIAGGHVRQDDRIVVNLPPAPHRPLERV